jgi:hypothetical protein
MKDIECAGIWPTKVPIAKGISSPEMSNIHRSGPPDLPLRAIPPLTALLVFERAATQQCFCRRRTRPGAQPFRDQPPDPWKRCDR